MGFSQLNLGLSSEKEEEKSPIKEMMAANYSTKSEIGKYKDQLKRLIYNYKQLLRISNFKKNSYLKMSSSNKEEIKQENHISLQGLT